MERTVRHPENGHVYSRGTNRERLLFRTFHSTHKVLLRESSVMQKQRTETKRPGINVPLNVFNKMKCEESSLCQKIHHHARRKILLLKKLNQPLCHYGQARRDRAGAGIFASEKNQNSGERIALPLPSVEQFCPQSPRFAGTRCRALSVDKTEEAL